MERKEIALCQNYLNFDLPLGTEVQHDRVYRKSHRSQGPGDGQAAAPPESPQGREERFCAHIPICVTVATATSGYTIVITCLILRLDVGDG